MSKLLRYLPVILVAAALCSFRFQETHLKDMQVMKAAEGQMEVYLDKIKPGKERDYGFVPQDDLNYCTVARPYRLLEFRKDFYTNPTDENEDYIVIRNEWRVPVVIKGQHKSLLTVRGNPGNYSVEGLGDPDLARELQKISRDYSDSEEFYILTIYPLLAEFFVHEGDNSFANAEFIPLASAVQAIPRVRKSNKPTYTLQEVQQMVKEAVLNLGKTEPEAVPKKKKGKS